MLRNYYWDFGVSKSVYIYFHIREEVRLELDSSWTPLLQRKPSYIKG